LVKAWSLQKAAAAGVYLHGLAGDEAAHEKIGLAAGEIAACSFPRPDTELKKFVKYEKFLNLFTRASQNAKIKC
jgi:hypothetical protein